MAGHCGLSAEVRVRYNGFTAKLKTTVFGETLKVEVFSGVVTLLKLLSESNSGCVVWDRKDGVLEEFKRLDAELMAPPSAISHETVTLPRIPAPPVHPKPRRLRYHRRYVESLPTVAEYGPDELFEGDPQTQNMHRTGRNLESVDPQTCFFQRGRD
jgi:isopentenyl diphosphate isomerase/L-lactate dehydrogenase-like FMN-dependent dehydrogenase